MPTTPTEIFIYSRKSRYTGAGESIDNQIEMCQEHAQRVFPKGCHFHVFEDEGFSAKNTDRPQWQRLMRELEQGHCHVLMCYRLDRISRSVSDFSTILDFLTDRQIDFISVRENFDTTTPMGRAMIYIASVFAQLERETITERIRDNKFKLYRTGRWQGGKAPMGFRSVKSTFMDDDGSKRHMNVLEANPEEREHLHLLFDKFLELGSLSALESFLLENHISTCMGNEYSKAVLRQTLTNPVYATNEPVVYDYLSTLGCDIVDTRDSFDGKRGLVGYARTVGKGTKNTVRARNAVGNWIIATGFHEGMIPGDQWVSIQQKIKENGEKHPRFGTSNVALLSSLIRCGKCGSPMIVKGNKDSASGEKLFYYGCRKKTSSHGKLCNMKNIHGPDFDRYVISLLKEHFASGGETWTALDSRINHRQMQKTDFQKEIKKLEKQIADNGDASVRLAGKMAYTQSDAEDNALRLAISELAEKNKQLQEELNHTKQKSIGSACEVMDIELMKETIDNFAKDFDRMPLEAQRENLKRIIRHIVWDGENATIELFPGTLLTGKKKQV